MDREAIALSRLAPLTSTEAAELNSNSAADIHKQQHQQLLKSENVRYPQLNAMTGSDLLRMNSSLSSGISSGLIDSADSCCRIQDSRYSTSVRNMDRLSPCYTNSYATLAPLQPLPPISTVSEKFGGLVMGHSSGAGGYAFMQNEELEMSGYDGGSGGGAGGGGGGCTFGFSYPKDNELEDGYETMESVEMMNRVTSGGYAAVQQTHYATTYQQTGVSTSTVKSEGATGQTSYRAYANGHVPSTLQKNIPMMMQQQQGCLVNGAPMILSPSVAPSVLPSMRDMEASPTHDLPSSSTDAGEETRHEMEEINTREIALKVSNELKKYSIPQAVFAQRILGRSQGTLSDLLRNPKPWSKLKSGRETFRRMWKWLQDTECRRLSQLRIAGGMQSFPSSTETGLTSNPTKQPSVVSVCKHVRDSLSTSRPDSQSAATTTTKKPRMVFTEIQRRTLVAIFKEIKRPSKEIQATIAEQLGLKVSTVVNFFMNARRRSVDKYVDDLSDKDTVSSAVSSTATAMDESTGQ